MVDRTGGTMTASPLPSPSLSGTLRPPLPPGGADRDQRAGFRLDSTRQDGTDAAPGAPPTREAVLALLLRQGEATATDLSTRLSVSVQVMRRHLRGLGDEGLVEASPTVEGPGRPSNRWRLTSAGRSRFPDGSEHFALGLLQSLAASMPPEALQRLLAGQALDKAGDYRLRIGSGSLAQRIERLVDLRRQEGYVAECVPDPDQGGSWVLSEFHCSVMRIAESFPIVCDQELQLMAHTFPDCRIERVHWRLESGHSCGFRLTPIAAQAQHP
jgi:DeoR family suf operon transcriptional repressor